MYAGLFVPCVPRALEGGIDGGIDREKVLKFIEDDDQVPVLGFGKEKNEKVLPTCKCGCVGNVRFEGSRKFGEEGICRAFFNKK